MNFRNRLILAFQAIKNLVVGIFSRFFTFCKNKPVEVISVVGVITSLYYSQMSLDKTVDALNQSDTQFKLNNTSQDEQDKRSKEQHDSLMSVLKQQKTLLDQQVIFLKQQNEIVTRNLGISKTQLQLAEEIQRREIEGGRCLFTINNVEITDTSLKMNDLSRPIVSFHVENIGKRPCTKYKISYALISKNWKLFSVTKNEIGGSPINSGEFLVNSLATSIDDIKNFYYFIKVAYYDDITGKEYSSEYFYHYKELRHICHFYEASSEEKEQMIKALASQ